MGSRRGGRGFKRFLEAVGFILAKFEPERSHGDPIRDQNYGFEEYFLESHRSVFFRIPFRPRSGRRAFATIFSDFGEKVAQLAGLIFSEFIF